MSAVAGQRDDGPKRRCVVCRKSDLKQGLLRFVRSPEGQVYFDARQRLEGRGAHVCASARCLEAAHRGALRRGFKGEAVVLPALDVWRREIEEALARQYREILGLGRRSGQLVVGASSVERALKEGFVVAYVLATDASEGTRRKYGIHAKRKSIEIHGLLDRASLGQALGRPESVVAGWVQGPMYQRFVELEEQLRALSSEGQTEVEGARKRGRPKGDHADSERPVQGFDTESRPC